MGSKKKTEQGSQAKAANPKALEVPQQPTAAEALAHTALRPTVQAALTLMDYNKGFGELAFNTLVTDLRQQCELASKGDLNRAEALLTAQAHTLDGIFNYLARKAVHCDYLNQYETYLRLGLKAQSQCRATLETLAAIKNPKPVAFVQQANIAHGPQQVNNEAAQPSQSSRARETEKQPNKLLESRNDKRLDTGAQARQASLLQRWKPWERSTGPKTAEGKARVSRNAFKGGTRPILRALSKLLKDQDKQRKHLV